MLSQVQAPKMGFLRVHGETVTLRDEVRSCEIRRALNVDWEIVATLVWPCVQNAPRKTGETGAG